MKARDERLSVMNEVCFFTFFLLQSLKHRFPASWQYTNAKGVAFCLNLLCNLHDTWTSTWAGSAVSKDAFTLYVRRSSNINVSVIPSK